MTTALSSPSVTLEEAAALQASIVELRRKLHSFPELSYQEYETSKLLAELLRAQGFEVKTGIARTGVLADFGSGAPVVAIRAEMDALPITERNDLEFRSTRTGVMHACGHDAHVACVVAAATMLLRRQLKGRLRLIMQPAEECADDEGKTGACRMVEEGALEGVNSIIGLHVSSMLPSGSVYIPSGAVFASADDFEIRIESGSEAGQQVDVVVIAAQIVQLLQQVVSRKVQPSEPAVLTVGSIHTLDEASGRCRAVVMKGTARSFSPAVREQMWNELQKICGVATAYGATAELRLQSSYPATINAASVAQTMQKVASDFIAKDNLLAIKPRMAAEDFSFFAQTVPAAFMLLGVEIKGERHSHHSPEFDLDEAPLHLGAAILAETALRLMNSNG